MQDNQQPIDSKEGEPSPGFMQWVYGLFDEYFPQVGQRKMAEKIAIAVYKKMRPEIAQLEKRLKEAEVIKESHGRVIRKVMSEADALKEQNTSLQTQLSEAQRNLTSMISEALEKSKQLDEAAHSLYEALNRITRLGHIRGYLAGDVDFVRQATKSAKQYPQPSTPPQTDK